MVPKFMIVPIPPFTDDFELRAPGAAVKMLGMDDELNPAIRAGLDKCFETEKKLLTPPEKPRVIIPGMPK
jgi:hypothetical protein